MTRVAEAAALGVAKAIEPARALLSASSPAGEVTEKLLFALSPSLPKA